MLRYSDILKLKEEGFSLRSIASSTANSRQKVREVTERVKQKGLVGPFDDEMTDKWIEEFLFPEKSLESSGRYPIDFDHVYKELAKPKVTLSLLHYEYEIECRANKKIPYSYRSFVRHYSNYANKHKATNLLQNTYADGEQIAKHPIASRNLKYQLNLEHYKGLETTQKGLPTRRLQPDIPEVERRSLQVYEKFERSDYE